MHNHLSPGGLATKANAIQLEPLPVICLGSRLLNPIELASPAQGWTLTPPKA